MKEAEFLGTLIPSHPDLLPIIQAVREKYDIPTFTTDDEALIELIFSDKEIDWSEVRKDIEERIRAEANLISPEH